MLRLTRWLHKNRQIVLLMVLFAIMSGIYSIVTPLFEMSDELWHYPMVKRLADGEGLPVQPLSDPTNVGPWRQQGSQPPLYYYLGAALTFWIDTSDMPEVRRLNPHVDNGVITPDGNINLVVHRTVRERLPWHGTVLAVHIVRFLSVAMSTASLYFTYLIGLEVFPAKRWLAIAGTAAMAFTPMFAFISGAVNNDNLAVLLSSIGLWLMLSIARAARNNRPTLSMSFALGCVLGLSALTKASVMGQFGLAGLTMAYAAIRKRKWQTFWLEGPSIIAIAIAIAGWWYWRNWVLYNDPLGLNAFIAVLGRRARPASLWQLWTERHGFMQSYWGLFGGVNVPMSAWCYRLLNHLVIASTFGVALTLWQKLKGVRFNIDSWMPALLSLLWIAGVVTPLVSYWARVTWSSQGRLVFSAIMSISLWFAGGLFGWMPERTGRALAAALATFMGQLTLMAPLIWIVPAYRIPSSIHVTESDRAVTFSEPFDKQPAIRLVGYEVEPDVILPGESVRITLHWQSLSEMDRSWSIFVHLVDSSGFLAGQRDMYPGQGLISTMDLYPGFSWTDQLVVPIRPSAYSPETLQVHVGLYDYNTCTSACERMLLSDGSNALNIGTANLQPNPSYSGISNPIAVNFGNQLELIGYALNMRTAHAGEEITLTLYWRGLTGMTTDYTISAQILGADTTIYAQHDSWPLNGGFPTTMWSPGEIITDTYPLTLSANTPPGEYAIQIVVYSQAEDGSFPRLQIVNPDGRLVEDFSVLTRIRVLELPGS